jgi:small-conductance mechanosensitive channel
MPEHVMNADAGALQWASAFWVTLALLAGLWIGRAVVRRLISPDTDGWFATVFHSTRFILLTLAVLLFGVSLVSRDWDLWLRPLIIGLAALQVGLWGNALIAHGLADYQRRHLTEDAEAVTSVRAAGFLARLLLFTLVVLLVLDNIPGVDVTALIAGLGIGGIAVALAVQNILADLFASFSISLDKPFAIGDFIVVGEYMGTVENIGLKTTRLRSLSGEQLVIANDDLLRSRIRNYRRMSERRVVFGFGIVYQTAYRKLQGVTAMVREIIEGTEQTRFDRAHFKAYGDSALEFEVVYYVLAPDYSRYMDIQESINLALFRRFEEEGVEFAYPTRTLYLRSQGGD